MLHFEHKIRVRYVECDQMGFVHHSVYAIYFEEARTEVLREVGLIYSEMEKENIIMPVRKMDIIYYYAAKYDDILRIEITMDKLPLLKCDLSYKVFNQKNELLTEASMQLFFAHKLTLRPMRIPEKYQEMMAKYNTK